MAQQQPQKQMPIKVPVGWKPSDAESLTKKKSEKLVGKEKMLQGLSLSFDLYNLGSRILGNYGGPEAALRVNLWHTYFPVFEAGVGMTNYTNEETNINYKTNAPYFRIGIDKNMLRNKKDFARLYAGFRYGFSAFKYSVKAPPQTDNIWGGQYYLNRTGVASTWGWLELGVGIDVRIVSFFHLGIGARYKMKLHATDNGNTEPWYVPGFGTVDTRWTLNYSLTFDISRGNRKKIKAGEVLPPEHQLQRTPSDSLSSDAKKTIGNEAIQKAQKAHEQAEAAHKQAEKASKNARRTINSSEADKHSESSVETTVPKVAGKRNTSE